MATQANVSTEQNVGEIFSKSEHFIEKYQKQIIIGVVAIILIVVAVLGIRHAYILPKEKEASTAMFKGENYFAQGQWKLALNGDSVNYFGFEEIIDKYGFTKTANLAKAYAGICYYKMGDPETAIKYLKKFNASDKMVSPAIIGLIGDCYIDLGKISEGIDYFNKAAAKADNTLLSPIYLKKAAIAYESEKNYTKALELYSKIKEKYATSLEAVSIDKYIDRVQALK